MVNIGHILFAIGAILFSLITIVDMIVMVTGGMPSMQLALIQPIGIMVIGIGTGYYENHKKEIKKNV